MGEKPLIFIIKKSANVFRCEDVMGETVAAAFIYCQENKQGNCV